MPPVAISSQGASWALAYRGQGFRPGSRNSLRGQQIAPVFRGLHLARLAASCDARINWTPTSAAMSSWMKPWDRPVRKACLELAR